LQANPVRYARQDQTDEANNLEFTAEENEEVIERLKSLGYMG
jgi:hypothetical protein